MTTGTRKDILKALDELSTRYPESRFGQLVLSVANWVPESSADGLWDLDDEQFLEAIQQHLAELAPKEQPPAVAPTKT
jgi:hypothetical protein